jgi:hypothetical protein
MQAMNEAKITPHYFNDRSRGIFAYKLFDRDGLPVRDTFATQIRIKLHGVGSIDWTRDQLADMIKSHSSAEMAILMRQDEIKSLVEQYDFVNLARDKRPTPISLRINRELSLYAKRAITSAIGRGASPETIHNDIALGSFLKNIAHLSGLKFDPDLIKLRAALVSDFYNGSCDDNLDFAAALNSEIAGFEYPDWSYKTVGEVIDSLPPESGSVILAALQSGVDNECRTSTASKPKG